MKYIILRVHVKFRVFGFTLGEVKRDVVLPVRQGKMWNFNERGVNVEVEGSDTP